jgi:hypothetical protein
MEANNNSPIQNQSHYPGSRPGLWSWITASVGIVVIMILIGGGALLAGRVWDPLWNPLRPNPNKVIAAALANLQETNALHTISNIDITSGTQVLSSSFIGDVDSRDPNVLKMQGSLDMTYSDAELQSAYAKSNLKVIGKDLYLNIADYNPLVNTYASILHINIDSLKGRWLLVSTDQFKNLASLYDLKQAILDKKLATFKKSLPDKVVSGQKIYHYLVTLNSAAVSGTLSNKSENLLKALGPLDVDLGIGSQDNNLESLSFSKKDVKDVILDKDIDVSVKIHNSNFNKQQLSIEQPNNFTKLEDVMTAK